MGPLETAMDFFTKLRGQNKTEEAYIDTVWAMRYPDPFPKSSPGWPYRGLKGQVMLETKSNPKVRALRP
jgi:hypothetical protein